MTIASRLSPTMARELADVMRLEAKLRPDDEEHLFALAEEIHDHDSIGELIAAIAAEAA